MNGQVQLRFETREAAVAYAERNGIAYRVFEPKPRRHILRQNGYGDNFAYQRAAPPGRTDGRRPRSSTG